MRGPPLCLLGMRTGSSLATRALVLLGADPGWESELMQGKPDDNPKGFWEQQALVDLNDDLLAELGGPWWDLPPLSPGWHEDPGLEPLRERARALIEDIFPNGGGWLWKDPRASLTLPFWQDVIGPMRYVVCVRSPAEVAASLYARDPVLHPWRESTRVFFRHLRDGLGHTADADRIVVFYEDWFEDFDAQLERLARFATGAPAGESAAAAARDFFESGLRHHHAEDRDGDLDPELRAAYGLLRRGTDEAGRLDPEAARQIEEQWLALEERVAETDETRELRARTRACWLLAHARQRHLEDATRGYEYVKRAYEQSAAARRELEERHDELAAELDEAIGWLREMNESVSWRITAPLRKAKRLASRR